MVENKEMVTPVTSALTPAAPSNGALAPVPADEVRLEGGFWKAREDLNRTQLLDHADRWIESMGWYDAFRVAAGESPARAMRGKLFTDADVYKLIEAFAWEVAQRPDPVREKRLQELATLVASAQEEDGYLNTFFGPQGTAHRYTNLSHGHELYCAGHLFQAAVARLRAGEEDELTRAAIRLADRVCEDFGPDGIDGIDGHPEIETALVELSRATGRRAYLDQAALFIARRGQDRFDNHPIGPEYYVDDVPVRAATVLRGHVVRALYLTAGAVDVAVETGDDALLDSLVAQWDATWGRRTYLTGGMGSRHLGESFGLDFELPPDRAYTETCGAVAAVMVAWRLLLATGEVRFADAIERLLYNMIATSPNAEGDRFFYVNPLLARTPGIEVGEGEAPFRKDTLRANWFWVSCCPTNVVRLLSSFTGYVASVSDGALTVHQLVDATVRTALPDGRGVGVRLRTRYPWDGLVEAEVLEGDGEWTLRLRVPGWASGATLEVDGMARHVGPGYVDVTRTWRSGDVVRLRIDMTPVVLRPDDRINAVRDTVAVQYGPLVCCAEELVDDDDAVDLDRFRMDPSVAPQLLESDGPSDVERVVRVAGELGPDGGAPGWPYAPEPPAGAGTGAAPERSRVSIDLIPYYAWSNRGASTMRVFIPAGEPSSAQAAPSGSDTRKDAQP
jgi:DUF1680 family protein